MLNICNEKETLVTMARSSILIEDVEEGEISDTASIEEISEDDFKKQDVRILKEQEVRVLKESSKPQVEPSRGWESQEVFDAYKRDTYEFRRGLYNFAWAQAVQNRPLNNPIVFAVEVEPDVGSNRSSSSSSSSGANESKEDTNVISDDKMDVKMEDVVKELEEGEIDLDSEEPTEKLAVGGGEEGVLNDSVIVKEEGLNHSPSVKEGPLDDSVGVREDVILNDSASVSEWEIDSKEKELVERVNSIRETLDNANFTENAQKSFEGACSRLQNSLESLKEIISEGASVSSKDDLIQQSYTAIQSVNSVFCTSNHSQKEQNKAIFSRLLTFVMSQDHPLFSPEEMKEINGILSSMDSPAVFSSFDFSNKEEEKPITCGVNHNVSDAFAENASHEVLNSSKNNFLLDSSSVESFLNKNAPDVLSEALKPALYDLRGRGVLAPLLDLHKDHDADNLPSPTRGTTPCLPVFKLSAIGHGVAKPEVAPARVAHERENSIMHPYETEALKAVSTYQQKFGRSSFFSQDRLPSPTPSEECDDADGDTGGEVSSSLTVGNVKNVNLPILARPVVSSAPHMDVSSARTSGSMIFGSNPTLKASSKSRDPRLRLANSDVSAMDINQGPLPVVHNAPKVDPIGAVISSRKHKSVEEPLDGPALKRQRNGSTNYDVRDAKTVPESGGWLENDAGTVGPQFMNQSHLIENTENYLKKMETVVSSPSTAPGKPIVTSGNEQVPLTGTSTIGDLRNYTPNPIMVQYLLKLQRLESEALKKPFLPPSSTVLTPISNSINSIVGAVPFGNVAPINPTGLGQKPAGILQVPQIVTVEDPGKVRMKPRDPRRILHNNTYQKSASLGTEQFKFNGAPTLSTLGSRGNSNDNKFVDQSDRKSIASQPSLPDIARQFTKNLENIANILSTTQPLTTPPPVAPQILPSQPLQTNLDRVDAKSMNSDSVERPTETCLTPDEGAAGTAKPQNMWGDVELLFEGYDDQQKAAIHTERTRRLEEQKKMFAARKLCLVLDLDHTLLNSAKFIEVEPMHDEILRKKEEQDREKPQRHLFRFPHMGMWTKLRPGIWNFLEKASKLYELHLYTMGNKLYATEMAKVLDPKGVLFAGRVISKGDDGDVVDGEVPKSKDMEGVLGMDSAVVIIDDSIRVWPHNKHNLIVVERYMYFPCSRRQFGLFGPSLLELDRDERPEDGTLASCLSVIERIHQIFFSQRSLDDVDVRNILACEQRKILSGCRILFSRVFPVGEAKPHLHPLWQTAEQFGAVCTTQIDEHVTHVVAISLGTDKVNWALHTGRYVVHPGWLEASALLYRRANEQDFAIKP